MTAADGAVGAAVDADVIVVGAGLSGLVAAFQLVARGVSVRVVEARDRVGGRTLSVPLGRGVADLGGQWVTPTQDRVAALAAELGVDTFAQERAGTAMMVEDASPRGSLWSRVPGGPAVELAYRIGQLERLRRRVPRDAPADAPQARAWDAITWGQWLDAKVRTPKARRMLTLLCQLHFAAEPAELSFLYALHTLNATGGLTGDSAFAGGEMRFVGGAQSLCLRLSQRLGERVHLGCAVTRLIQTPDQVTVWCGPNAQRSHFVILALPPSLAASIPVHPSLPRARAGLQFGMPLGPVIKCAVAYARAFWRDRGLSGEAYNPSGTVSAVVDHSDPHRGQPALLAFVVGAQARQLSALPVAGRRRVVLDELVALFGTDAAHADDYTDKDWSRDPWSAGCVAVARPGLISQCGPWSQALRAPVGRIHFAGTETATRWPHYLDGAVEAGQRAAAEVLHRLA